VTIVVTWYYLPTCLREDVEISTFRSVLFTSFASSEQEPIHKVHKPSKSKCCNSKSSSDSYGIQQVTTFRRPIFLFTKGNTKHQFNMRQMEMIEKMTVT
jgi:hypothetical protein